mgnify:CR=1 FL=1
MDLKSLVEILQIASIHKNKIKSLFWDYYDGDDDILERICEFYLALRNTIVVLEKIIQSTEAETGTVNNVELLSLLHHSISESSKAEDCLAERISVISH